MKPRKRNYSTETKIKLWVRAGGRCEYPGCNCYLLQDYLTTRYLTLGEIAHNIGLSNQGPRGNSLLTEDERNHVDNLLLLCAKCHTLVDTGEFQKDYTFDELKEYKLKHEQRIFDLTSQADALKSVVVRMRNKIHGDAISISDDLVRDAMWKCEKQYPDYLLQRPNNIEIDLSQMPDKIISSYWDMGKQIIDETFDNRIKPNIGKSIQHISIFAIARIPFLIYLGFKIGDKIPVTVYQKQFSEKEDWIWCADTPAVTFKFDKIHIGKNYKKVALVVSLSGKIHLESLPVKLDDYVIYEMWPVEREPSRDIIQNKQSLINFKQSYQALLRLIEKEQSAHELLLFPAVPLSVGVYIGRAQLKAVSPNLIIYDRGEENNYVETFTIKRGPK